MWLIFVASALFLHCAWSKSQCKYLGLINIAEVGILFVYMLYATNGLWLSIGYHIIWSYFQGNVFGFAISGTTPNENYSVELAAGRDWLTGGALGLEGGLMATLLILVGFVATRVYFKWRCKEMNDYKLNRSQPNIDMADFYF
ncbi:hypothetical protein JSQ81_16800 [Sporosarcina sp. Marseille-Q4063]|uniref:hypothetical protein n=1 Tax=Sporosarcina sp. Marseille-Q4063 TaxID=2810514 RepID=UPI001BAF3912|nr:hypothetical protein [Sporosarcina sp. Marseille-Q4063]QUW21438.1 hypothetical protein JSQ81_16800 [Sporosarcina sp. Marseille-Q4063]